MKIIDQTPFIDEKGEINLFNRAKAMLTLGPSWYGEVQAQSSVMASMGRNLDRGYTLLRNFTLPGTQATIPMILVGPTGILMLYVTNLEGVYRAKGDEWGIVEHNSTRMAPVNLMTRTARMARAVQVFLERQGYALAYPVEGILIGTNPSLHVESVRPIVRIVLSDALERFILSIPQSRVVMGSEAVMDIINRLQHPHETKKASPIPEAEPSVPVVPDEYAPQPETERVESLSESLGFAFEAPPEPMDEAPFEAQSPFTPAFEDAAPVDTFRGDLVQRPARTRFSGKQWALLIVFGAFEIILLVVFAILVLSDFM